MKVKFTKFFSSIIVILLAFLFICCYISSPCSATSNNNRPQNLTAIPNEEGIKLTWKDCSDNEKGFYIERKEGNKEFKRQVIIPGNKEIFVDKTTKLDVIYTYRIKAIGFMNINGRATIRNISDWSNTSSTFRFQNGPKLLKVERLGFQNKIKVSWVHNSNNIDRYIIERKTSNGKFTPINSLSADYKYFYDCNLLSGYTYYYRVRACKKSGEVHGFTEYTDTKRVVIPNTDTPEITYVELREKSNSEDRTVIINWRNNSWHDGMGFLVERKIQSRDKEGFKRIGSTSDDIDYYNSTVTFHDDINEECINAAGDTYTYRVIGMVLNPVTLELELTEYSNEAAIEITANAPPVPPTNLNAIKISKDSIRFAWSDNSNNENRFEIERRVAGVKDEKFSVINSVGKDVISYSDMGLSTGTTYMYRIRAVNRFGKSPYSEILTVSTLSKEDPNIISKEQNNKTDKKTSNNADKNSGKEPRKTIRLYLNSTSFYVGDEKKQMDISPIIKRGRTLLPVRYVIEPLGAELKWDDKERKVTLILDGKVIELWIGKNIAKVNGIEKYIDTENHSVVPETIAGRTMLPIRFIAENFGFKVEWNEETKEIKTYLE